MDRIDKLKEDLYSKNSISLRGFREYGRIWWHEEELKLEGYNASSSKYESIRLAQAIRYMLNNVDILIEPNQLLAGIRLPSPEDKKAGKKLAKLCPWLREDHMLFIRLKDDERLAKDNCLFCLGGRHYIIDFECILDIGLTGLLSRCRNKIRQSADGEDRTFYTSTYIIGQGILDYIKRYLTMAQQQYHQTSDTVIKADLSAIAENLESLLRGRPNTFYSALQLVWFLYMLAPDGLGRMDQYLFPFYKEDLEKGILDRNRAGELLKCFWIKLNTMVGIYNYGIFNLTIGGKTADGYDGTNQLSYLIIDTLEEMGFINPSLSIRYSPGNSTELLARAAAMIDKGTVMPSFYNDQLIIQMLMDMGIDRKDANNYALTGCGEITIPGKANFWAGAGYVNVLKCLELALNRGVSFLEGKQLGPDTPLPENFRQLKENFFLQFENAIDLLISTLEKRDSINIEHIPNPLLSFLMPVCIDRGLDYNKGGTPYNATQCYALGIANTVDALMAIKKWVFTKRTIAMDDLIKVLKNDYKGSENIKKMLSNTAQRYGNDLEEPDTLASGILDFFLNKLEQYSHLRRGRYTGGAISWLSYKTLGNKTGASADGRNARDMLADAINAVPGHNTEGPTALLKSAVKLSHHRAAGCLVLTLDLNKSVIGSADVGTIIPALIKSYFELSGMQLQINQLDKTTLQKARLNPQKYRHIIVRVAGFSAYFVTLSPDIQEEIIKGL
ncbi:MAG: pyruvate formate lyase family protein [Mahellales bacterium]|jgi:pyruvate-formate lyase